MWLWIVFGVFGSMSGICVIVLSGMGLFGIGNLGYVIRYSVFVSSWWIVILCVLIVLMMIVRLSCVCLSNVLRLVFGVLISFSMMLGKWLCIVWVSGMVSMCVVFDGMLMVMWFCGVLVLWCSSLCVLLVWCSSLSVCWYSVWLVVVGVMLCMFCLSSCILRFCLRLCICWFIVGCVMCSVLFVCVMLLYLMIFMK